MAVKVVEEKCSGCAICMDVCPMDAIKVNDVAKIDEEACTECGSCVDECPNEALVLN